jgi:hypothetical protein
MVIVGLLGFAAGVLSSFASEAADREFLEMLIPATGQMLAFTGIIIGVMYPALRFLVSDTDREIERLVERLSRVEQSSPESEGITKRIARLDTELQTARGVQMRVLVGLTSTAACLGAALVIELLHLRLLAGLSLSVAPEVWFALFPVAPRLSSIAFSIELFFVTGAIALLVLSLIRGVRLAFR